MVRATEALAAGRKAREAYAQASHGPGRPPAWQAREEAAVGGALAEAEAAVVTAVSHRDGVRAAVRDLGDRYHPVDLATGALLSGDAVESCLLEGFDAIWESAARAGLGDRNARVIELIAKAQRVLPSLVGWVRAWHRMVGGHVAALGLSVSESAWLLSSLLPAVCLDRVARRGRDKDLRERVGDVVERLKRIGNPTRHPAWRESLPGYSRLRLPSKPVQGG